VIAAVFILTVGGAERSDSAGGDPIRIGAVFSETGGLRSIGSPGLAGMRLAAAEINARGGILGRRVQIAAADSRSRPAAVARAVRRLIEDSESSPSAASTTRPLRWQPVPSHSAPASPS